MTALHPVEQGDVLAERQRLRARSSAHRVLDQEILLLEAAAVRHGYTLEEEVLGRLRQEPNAAPTPAEPELPDVIEVGQLRIDRKGHACRWKGRNLMLEPIPFELLRFLAGHAGQPLARQEIIDELWPGNDDDSAGRSLNAAIWRLRQALGDDNRVGTVRHYGYSYEPE